MPHWDSRPEPRWKDFIYKQPYAKGLGRVRELLADPTRDFDPATFWQWGTMQAMALITVLKDCEARFGEAGQQLVHEALRKTGLDVGRQILADISLPADLTEAEFASFYATVINRIAYASLEDARIDDAGKVTFDILFCPHQDHYTAFDCRVQRYFVQGMIEAAQEVGGVRGWEVRFDTTIPSGAETCHFTVWKPSSEERDKWNQLTGLIEAEALSRARRRQP